MQRPLDSEEWGVQNRRRPALIRKRFTSGLSTEDKQELRTLQDLADWHVEAMDRAMLSDVQAMKLTVEASLKDAG